LKNSLTVFSLFLLCCHQKKRPTIRSSPTTPATVPPAIAPTFVFLPPDAGTAVDEGVSEDEDAVDEVEDSVEDESGGAELMGKGPNELDRAGAAVARAPMPVSRTVGVTCGVPVTCLADDRKSLKSWMEAGLITPTIPALQWEVGVPM
jgi:hypothetical protein